MNTALVTDPKTSNDRRITVAYVVYSFHMGGLERCVAHFVNRLDRDRFHPPLIISLKESGDAEEWLTVDDVETFSLHKRDGNDPGVVRRLARVLRDRSVDVVHSHNWGTLVETILARRWAGVPGHLHAEHGQELSALRARGLKARLRNMVRRFALAQASQVVVCAESVRERVHQQCGFAREKMLFLPNGVDRPESSADTPQRDAIRTGLGLTESDIVIGSLSRLVPVKDFPTAIAAFSLAAQHDERMHFLIVGHGPNSAEVKEVAEASPVHDRIHLVGRQENIADWLAAFDIYINSSLSEAMNMSILEAMSLGVPIVATDVGDNASILGGDECGGLVVPAADPAALSAALLRLVAEPALRHQLSARARARYESNYTRDMMVQAYGDAYLRLAPVSRSRSH